MSCDIPINITNALAHISLETGPKITSFVETRSVAVPAGDSFPIISTNMATILTNTSITKKERLYKNGQPMCQEFYKDGKMEGEEKWWYLDGQPRYQHFYKDGKREGEQKA